MLRRQDFCVLRTSICGIGSTQFPCQGREKITLRVLSFFWANYRQHFWMIFYTFCINLRKCKVSSHDYIDYKLLYILCCSLTKKCTADTEITPFWAACIHLYAGCCCFVCCFFSNKYIQSVLHIPGFTFMDSINYKWKTIVFLIWCYEFMDNEGRQVIGEFLLCGGWSSSHPLFKRQLYFAFYFFLNLSVASRQW